MDRRIDFEHIKELRTALGWDQTELARRAQVDRSVVSRLERGVQGDLRAAVLIGIADALKVPLDALVRRTDTPDADHLALAPELTAAVNTLAALPQEHQARIAALLAAYVRTVPR